MTRRAAPDPAKTARQLSRPQGDELIALSKGHRPGHRRTLTSLRYLQVLAFDGKDWVFTDFGRQVLEALLVYREQQRVEEELRHRARYVDEDGKTIHRPVISQPVRLRPDGDDETANFYRPSDPGDERGHRESPQEWLARAQVRYMHAIAETVRGVELTDYEIRQLRWLAGLDGGQVVVLSLLDRMYRQGVEDERARAARQ